MKFEKIGEKFKNECAGEKLISGKGKMIKIRCQRFNPEEKIYEEIEVEVPAPIYETIQVYNETENIVGNNPRAAGKSKSFNSGRRASFGARLKNLFTPSTTTAV